MLDPGRKVQDLSFGNRKKVAIVAALQHNPRLLILDEPTSGLDPLMQHEFFEILKEYNSLGTTVFLSSHVLSEIQNNCRNAAIIREGKILLSDSVENLTHTQAKRVQLRGEVDLSSLAEVNKLVSPSMETIYFRSDTRGISSSMVKELHYFGKDVSSYVPPEVWKCICENS